MVQFATGAAVAAQYRSQVFTPDARRPVRYQPTPTTGHPGAIQTPTGATQTVGEGPPIPDWTLQKWRPASVMASAQAPSRPASMYSGGDSGWNSQAGTGLNEAIYAQHPTKIAKLFTSHMSGASGLSGQMSTQHSADGTAGLTNHAPILSPAIIPKLRSTRGLGNRFNHGGIDNHNVPSVFVPSGGLNAFGS